MDGTICERRDREESQEVPEHVVVPRLDHRGDRRGYLLFNQMVRRVGPVGSLPSNFHILCSMELRRFRALTASCGWQEPVSVRVGRYWLWFLVPAYPFFKE